MSRPADAAVAIGAHSAAEHQRLDAVFEQLLNGLEGGDPSVTNWRERGQRGKRILIVGTGALGRATSADFVDRRGASRVIGYLSWRGDRVPSALSAPLLGASTDLAGFLARHPVSEVYLAARSEQHGDELASAARTCDAFGVRLAVPMLPFRLTRGRARRRPLVIALIVVANAVLGYLQVFEGNRGLDNARTAGFTTLVLTQPFNCCKAGSKTTSALRDGFVNPRLWGAVVLGAVLQIAVVHVGLLDAAFGTVPLTPDQSLVCTGMASLVLWVSEVRKLIGRALAGRG